MRILLDHGADVNFFGDEFRATLKAQTCKERVMNEHLDDVSGTNLTGNDASPPRLLAVAFSAVAAAPACNSDLAVVYSICLFVVFFSLIISCIFFTGDRVGKTQVVFDYLHLLHPLCFQCSTTPEWRKFRPL
jgi:hypothetical protein